MSYRADQVSISNNKLIHAKQREAFDDKARFKFILAGRRGGKTRLIREDIIQSIWDCPAGGELFYIGPTLAQAYELIWDELDNRLYKTGIHYTPMISKRRFDISGGRKIFVIGAEKIRRIRGHKVYKVYLDELAFFEAPLSKIWEAVRPSLTDLKGSAIFATTPNGKGTEAYDFYLQTLNKKEWKYFHWHTLDNPYIDPTEIENAKNELDEKGFRQEYLASWESFEGLAYYNFNESVHIQQCSEISKDHQIDLSFDFNVNPTTLLVSQNIKGTIYFKKEYSFKNSSTIETIKAFCSDFKDYKNQLFAIFGDASGNSRASTTGKSDYFYIKEALGLEGFNYKYNVPASNPAIVDRVMTANAWLKNYNGESKIVVDPSCHDLIRDFSGQELDGRVPSDKNNMGHKSDAATYNIWMHQLLQQRQGQRMIIL